MKRICPVCGKTNNLEEGFIQYRCKFCKVWAHIGNWKWGPPEPPKESEK